MKTLTAAQLRKNNLEGTERERLQRDYEAMYWNINGLLDHNKESI